MTEQLSASLDVEPVLAVESSVLRTLCLTINSAGSALKYVILEGLSEDDFSLPATKALFAALLDLHAQGDFVVSSNLNGALRERSIELPDEGFIDNLFTGQLPASEELGSWLERLKTGTDEAKAPRRAMTSR